MPDPGRRPLLAALVLPVLAGSGCSSGGSGRRGEDLGRVVTSVLAARSAAVTAADAGAAARSWGPVGAQLLPRLRTLPVRSWSYAALAQGGTSTVSASGGSIARVPVRLTYRLADDGRDVVRDRITTWTRQPSGWALSADEPVRGVGAPVDLWDQGPVRVATSGRVVVVMAAGPAAVGGAGSLAAEVAAAASRVSGVWGAGDGGFAHRRVVVLAPGSVAGAAALLGRRAADLAGTVAETTGPQDLGPGGAAGRVADRVVIVPGAFGRLSDTGRRVVLAHELTHVLTRALVRTTVPAWLEEGIAEWVAWTGTGAPAATVTADAVAAVRRDGVPAALPAAADLDGPGGPAGYGLAWVACDLLAAGGARWPRLRAAYLAAAGVTGSPAAADLDVGDAAQQARWTGAVRAAGWSGPGAFLRAWQARLGVLAGAPGPPAVPALR